MKPLRLSCAAFQRVKHLLPGVINTGFHGFGGAAQTRRNVSLPAILEGKLFQWLAQLRRQGSEGSGQTRQPLGSRQGFHWCQAGVVQVGCRHVAVGRIVIRQRDNSGLAAAGAQAVPRQVQGDGVEPGLKPRPRAERMAMAIHPEKSLMEKFVRFRGISQHARQSLQKRALMPKHQPVKRLILVLRQTGHVIRIRRVEGGAGRLESGNHRESKPCCYHPPWLASSPGPAGAQRFPSVGAKPGEDRSPTGERHFHGVERRRGDRGFPRAGRHIGINRHGLLLIDAPTPGGFGRVKLLGGEPSRCVASFYQRDRRRIDEEVHWGNSSRLAQIHLDAAGVAGFLT